MSMAIAAIVILSWQGQNKPQEQTFQFLDENADTLNSSIAAQLLRCFA